MSQHIKIISDSPKTISTNFGFDAYAKSLVDMILNKKNTTPFTIGIYGPWGTGKTTLMQSMKHLLGGNSFYKAFKDPRPSKTVWFQAWKYEKEEELLAGLIEEILRTIKQEGTFIEALKADTEKFLSGTHLKKGVGTLIKDFLKVSVNDFLKDPEYRSKLGYYDIFQDFFNRLIWSYTRLRPMFHSEEEPNDQEGALTIFVDDLDRCPEPRIIKVLETIKLFMDKKGCIFVIGAADDIIHKALKTQNYSETDAREFMDKIVQVTFNLPPVDDMEFKYFLKNLVIDEDIEKIMPHMDAIVRATHSNIRKFKRFLNDLYLMDGINRYRSTGIEFNSLLLWKVLMFQAPELKGETIQTILMIQNRIQTLLDKKAFDKEGKIPEDVLKKEVREVSLHSYLSNHQVVTLFRQFDLNESQLKQLITIGDTVKSETTKEVEESEKVQTRMKGEHEFDLMVKVRKGPFLFGEKKEERIIEKDFEIDIYPVTNSQFRRFIEKGGYKKDAFWSKEGWRWREENEIVEPEYWINEKWNKADYPVVGISFYEAKAYAKWAGKRLPTEEEWERAARGIDGRIYPWGDEFSSEKCNTDYSRIRKTTAVTRYPNGISPDGCYDMIGNIWEWTSSLDEINLPIQKGLSWNDDDVGSGCVARGRDDFPSFRNGLIGFRCARIL